MQTRSKVKAIIIRVVIRKKKNKRIEVTTISRIIKDEVVEAKEGNSIIKYNNNNKNYCQNNNQ